MGKHSDKFWSQISDSLGLGPEVERLRTELNKSQEEVERLKKTNNTLRADIAEPSPDIQEYVASIICKTCDRAETAEAENLRLEASEQGALEQLADMRVRAEKVEAKVKELKYQIMVRNNQVAAFEKNWEPKATAQRYREALEKIKTLEAIEDCGEYYHDSCGCTEEYLGRVHDTVDEALEPTKPGEQDATIKCTQSVVQDP